MAEKALEAQGSSLLAIGNPRVRSVALRLRWKPKTLVRRVANALPAPAEQEIYLRVAESVHILPESVAKILRGLLGNRELQRYDMNDVPLGNNLRVNLFSQTLDLLLETLAVTHVLREEYGSIAMETATALVKAYGPDHVEIVVDSLRKHILDNFDDLDGARRVAIAMDWLSREGLTWCEENGTTYPSNVDEWLEANTTARYMLYRRIGFPNIQRKLRGPKCL